MPKFLQRVLQNFFYALAHSNLNCDDDPAADDDGDRLYAYKSTLARESGEARDHWRCLERLFPRFPFRVSPLWSWLRFLPLQLVLFRSEHGHKFALLFHSAEKKKKYFTICVLLQSTLNQCALDVSVISRNRKSMP